MKSEQEWGKTNYGFRGKMFCNELTDALKNSLVVKNSVAIMMPYLRSQVSLVTAQPEVECVVLPAFNINKMLDNE